MKPSALHFFPLAGPFLVALFLIFLLAVAAIEVGAIRYAYEKIGIPRRHVFTLLLLSLLGSYVNIPVAELPAEHIVSGREMTFYGMRYVVPVVRDWPATVVAVNLGGAVIPTLLSLYLVVKKSTYVSSLIGVIAVAAITHALAWPLPGVGIAVPSLVPPLAAAGVALALSRSSAPTVAYVAGSLGTLIGGDLMNLGSIRGLGAPVASIGGAGTFDGIFLSGLLAVLLA